MSTIATPHRCHALTPHNPFHWTLPMKRTTHVLIATLLALASALPASAKDKGKEKSKDKVERETIQYKNTPRYCYYQIPSAADPKTPLPAVVLVHQQSNYATEMTKYWHDFASQQGFIIIAPESLTYAQWEGANDGPDFFHACVDATDKLHPIDRSRIYIFGRRGGGVYTMFIALYDSTYYAAAAVHGAVMDPSSYNTMSQAQRKIPFGLWMGDRDPMLTVYNAQNEEAAFKAQDFPFELHVMSFTAGGYEGSADEIDEQAWKFFQKYQLPSGSGATAPSR